jgi:hypothetical protein
MVQLLSKEDFFDIEECECGKPVFKFHNTSKNIHVMKCTSTNQEYDLKTKKWVLSKKQPCKMYNIYKGEPVVINQIKKKEAPKENKPPDLKERLVSLFNFLPISNHSTTLQEIDLIVKWNLKREPRKTFYYPSIGNLRISHHESFEDYRARIFSEEIIDRDVPPVIKVVKPVLKPVVKPVTKRVLKPLNDFVDVSDEDSSSDTNSECSREYSDTASDKEDSDYSEDLETSEAYEDPVEEDAENFDDYSDDFGGEPDY